MKIKEYKNLELSKGRYGGDGGDKIGIIDNNDWYLLKLPKNVKNLTRVNLSYNNMPISEYIGSKIYESLGFEVHETNLGIYNNKLVCACKDFTNKNKIL